MNNVLQHVITGHVNFVVTAAAVSGEWAQVDNQQKLFPGKLESD